MMLIIIGFNQIQQKHIIKKKQPNRLIAIFKTKSTMKPTTTENLIADQIFKITKSDDTIIDFINDCNDTYNSVVESKR